MIFVTILGSKNRKLFILVVSLLFLMVEKTYTYKVLLRLLNVESAYIFKHVFKLDLDTLDGATIEDVERDIVVEIKLSIERCIDRREFFSIIDPRVGHVLIRPSRVTSIEVKRVPDLRDR